MTDILSDHEPLIALRRVLHQNPELSGQEHETAQRIVDFLKNYPPDKLITNLGGAGVAAVYEGEKSGKTILIRCELDGLAITAISDKKHRSARVGFSHTCGHDGHMTMVAGLVPLLHKKRPSQGRVVLLFQPAEETGEGAAQVLADAKFEQIKPDYAFALHNLPGYPLGQVLVKTGPFTAAVNSIIIKLKGKTAHAGEPHNGVNPALAIAEIVQKLNSRVVSDPASDDFCLITPIHVSMGEKAYGVSAGEGEVHYTLRCRTNKQMRELEQETENLVREIADRHNLKHQTEWTQSFHANQNDPTAVEWIREAAKLAGAPVSEPALPFSWGEDFGLFTEKFPGAMFGLGSGSGTPALHNPDYDFPDELIPTGVNIFYQIIQQVKHA